MISVLPVISNCCFGVSEPIPTFPDTYAEPVISNAWRGAILEDEPTPILPDTSVLPIISNTCFGVSEPIPILPVKTGDSKSDFNFSNELSNVSPN